MKTRTIIKRILICLCLAMLICTCFITVALGESTLNYEKFTYGMSVFDCVTNSNTRYFYLIVDDPLKVPIKPSYSNKNASSRYIPWDLVNNHDGTYTFYIEIYLCPWGGSTSVYLYNTNNTYLGYINIGANYHNWVEDDSAIDPTCTENGREANKSCSRCGAAREGAVIPALGHADEIPATPKDPTCTEDGNLSDGTACSRCGAFIQTPTILPKLGHDEIVTTPAKEPTCTEDGNVEGTFCSRCKAAIIKPDKTPALGHAWGTPNVLRQPVRNQPGQQEYTCLRCKTTKKEDIIVKVVTIALNTWYEELYAHKDKNNRDTVTINATVYPDNVSNDKLVWSSKDESVATVDANGVVTAKSKGSTVIYAKAADGSNVYARCEIDVLKDTKAKLKKLTANKKKITLKKGETYPVKLTFKPAKVFNNTVTWKTSNKKIATVDKNGVITAKKKGTCTITATSKLDKSKKVTITVKVKK